MTFRKLLILSAIIPGLQRIMGSGPVSSPAHVRCECGDIGPGNCTALTQPPLPYTAPPTTAQQQPAARFIFGPYLQAWAS